jgi:N-acetylglucosaminyldiphosphoundecaprenol N-acetyl-beta-D-mannosaminyltransferase
MTEVLRRIEIAADGPSPFVFSTPNLNFLVTSLKEPEFRESLLMSDLCTADGMPIVWIARILGIPIKGRVAGSDIFPALKKRANTSRPLKVFFFGATENVVSAVASDLQANSSTLRCVGWTCPGYGTVEDLSSDRFISDINASNADFVVTALGAEKGQLWLKRNHHRLRVPIRAHLGATLNFEAGTVRRAPILLQKLALEWLWRIAQEPYLWSRYCRDGGILLRLLLTRALPLAIGAQFRHWKRTPNGHNLVIEVVESSNFVTLGLSGAATADQVETAIRPFEEALAAKKRIAIDLAKTSEIDARFLGLLLMVRKQLRAEGNDLEFTGITPKWPEFFASTKLVTCSQGMRGSECLCRP